MKVSEKIDDFGFWLKEKFVFPVQNWYIDHFNWIHMEAQVFKEWNAIYVKWNGEYNKKTSLIEKFGCPRLFKKLDWVYDGSVIQCDYIWGMDGFLKNVRRVKCLMTLKDLVLCKNGVMEKPPYVKGDVTEYLTQFDNFCEVRNGQYGV